ncbi:hypothetical protein [Paraburkholderia aromaticivorans]|uniref:hypothetical protein n=1 Tax=Paraburkholderia aromaticivorans TaxID=2026199 RepID=UPI001455DE7B|nr:hypothetical protein [Paraburkholderia aromaticivorans]
MSGMIIASRNRGKALNGLSVMLAEWLAIVNLKNKLLSRNRMYEENRYRAFDMRTGVAGAPRQGILARFRRLAAKWLPVWFFRHRQVASERVG